MMTKKTDNINGGKDTKQQEPSFIINRDAKSFSHCRRQFGSFL